MFLFRIAIADRFPLLVLGLTRALESCGDFRVVYSGVDSVAWIDSVRRHAPEIAIVDPSLIGPPSETLAIFASERLATRLVLFDDSREDVHPLFSENADRASIMSRKVSPEGLIRTLRQIGNRQQVLSSQFLPRATVVKQASSDESAVSGLTDRERQIIRLVAKGFSNKEIGRRLNITDGTIKVHLYHVFKKLEVSNRTELAAFAISQPGELVLLRSKLSLLTGSE